MKDAVTFAAQRNVTSLWSIRHGCVHWRSNVNYAYQFKIALITATWTENGGKGNEINLINNVLVSERCLQPSFV
jgi:hypothetical protein